MGVNVHVFLRAVPRADFLAGIAAVESVALGLLYVLGDGRFCFNRPEGDAFAGIAASVV